MSLSWSRLTAHAHEHHGTITASAAHKLKIKGCDLASWCSQSRLARPQPGVYVVAGSPSTWHQRVAIAAGSSNGAASHRTAAALWGLDGVEPRRIEVLAAHGRYRRRTDWTLHVTRRFRSVDLAEVDGAACTAVPRTILDLAAVEHPFVVGQALDHACRLWPGMIDTIALRFLELGGRGRPGARLMRTMLEERFGRGRFAQSGFETRTMRLVGSAGMPEPVLQHCVRDGDFVAHLDLAWPAIRWAVECDSLAYHSGKRAHEWDRQRRRRLKQLGWDVVEVTYDDVVGRPAATAAQLVELHRLRTESLRSGRGEVQLPQDLRVQNAEAPDSPPFWTR